jgi:hypothetical protein
MLKTTSWQGSQASSSFNYCDPRLLYILLLLTHAHFRRARCVRQNGAASQDQICGLIWHIFGDGIIQYYVNKLSEHPVMLREPTWRLELAAKQCRRSLGAGCCVTKSEGCQTGYLE